MMTKLDDGKQLIVQDWKCHISEDNTPKSYAKEEHLHFVEECLKNVKISNIPGRKL